MADEGDDGVYDKDDSVVWQVSFDPATSERSFIVGETPPEGHEDVALSGTLDPDRAYGYTFYYDNGRSAVNGFTIRILLDGTVEWDKNRTAEDFAERTQCASSSST